MNGEYGLHSFLSDKDNNYQIEKPQNRFKAPQVGTELSKYNWNNKIPDVSIGLLITRQSSYVVINCIHISLA